MGEVLGNQVPEIAAVTVDEWTARLEEVLRRAAIPCGFVLILSPRHIL